jgi:hypothetical protein
VKAGIQSVAADYGAEEAMLVTIVYEHQARRRSYELVAQAFGLPAATLEEAGADQPTRERA